MRALGCAEFSVFLLLLNAEGHAYPCSLCLQIVTCSTYSDLLDCVYRLFSLSIATFIILGESLAVLQFIFTFIDHFPPENLKAFLTIFSLPQVKRKDFRKLATESFSERKWKVVFQGKKFEFSKLFKTEFPAHHNITERIPETFDGKLPR